MFAACAVLGLAGAVAGSAATAANPAPLTLRLADVPKGWMVGDDSGCGPLGTEDASPQVADLVRRFQPVMCRRDFERLWGGGGTFFVQSIAFHFAVADGARQAFAVAESLTRYASSLHDAVAEPTVLALGDEALRLNQPRAFLPGPQPSAAAAVVWRSGEVLSIVAVGATSLPVAAAEAVAYGQKQQRRIDAPTPVSDGDFDDVLVAIDNPRLGVPVWWLGRNFDPPGALPAQTLRATGGPFARGAGPGNIASLEYASAQPRTRGGIYLQIWKRPAWKRFLATRLGRLIDSPCARQTTMHVRAGTALIQRYWATPQSRPCPKRAPNRSVALLFTSNVVVTVNAPMCLRCVRVARPGAYGAADGLEAVVRALRRR